MTEMDHTTNMPLKRCGKCHNSYPATKEYFCGDKNRNDGLYPLCKRCKAIAAGQMPREKLPDGFKRCARKDECINPAGSLLPADENHFHRNKNGWAAYCKVCVNNRLAQYYQTNKDVIKERVRQYQTDNTERIRARKRRYRQEHIAQEREREQRQYRKNYQKFAHRYAAHTKEWRKKNPAKYKAQKYRRRANLQSFAVSFDDSDWEQCLKYWQSRCAYCGNQQGLFFAFRLTADHWIPLTDPRCPGTVPINILPCCQACNSSKNNHDPIEWLNSKFGKRDAAKRLKKIIEYFEWIKSDH